MLRVLPPGGWHSRLYNLARFLSCNCAISLNDTRAVSFAEKIIALPARLAVLIPLLLVSVALAQQPEPPLPAASEEGEVDFKVIPEEPTLVPIPPNAPPGPSAPMEGASPSYSLPLAPADAVKPVLPKLEFATEQGLSTSSRVYVKHFRFHGNHVFSSGELGRVVAKFTGREISSEELEEARQELSLYYVNQGYINSGAILEEQDPSGGVITFQIIEGRLTSINLTGNSWFRGYWLRHEIRQAAGKPLNFNRLKERLQLLRQNPTISRVNAELRPGGKAGESILDFQVRDEQPFRLGIELSNKRPPSVGAEILEMHASDLNLSGHNDPLELTWGVAHANGSRLGDGWEYSGEKNIEGSYAFPFTPWETMVEVHASKSDSAIVEQPFNLLNITSNLERYGAGIRQPIIQTLHNEWSFLATLDHARSETFLLDRPFSLSPGEIDGVMDVTALRLAMEGVNRSQVHVFSVRSTVNVGLNALGSTHDNGTTRDSEFVSWVGQAQYVRRLFGTDNLAILRLNAQLSNDELLPLEQFSLGGVSSVRGYRENQLLRDNGIFGSLEFHVPVLYSKAKAPVVSLAPFFDMGSGWNTRRNGSANSQETLASAGMGLLFTPNKYLNAQIYWGYAFNRNQVVKNGSNLQDYGLHFALNFNAF